VVDAEGGGYIVECFTFDTSPVGAGRKDEVGKDGEEALV